MLFAYFMDFGLLIFISPALLLGFWAQGRVRSTYARAKQVPVGMTGCAAAMRILERAGIGHLHIEQVPGRLSDHYDPRHKVLRLSPEVYHGRTAAAVGIAAHEAGHAIQDATNYAPLVIRNAAVPAAGIGSNIGLLLAGLGVFFNQYLLLVGIILFSAVVFFQIVNLPVEFDASARAKAELAEAGIVNQEEFGYVRSVLSAAALTYVAATLQAVLTLVYFIWRLQAANRD